MPESDHEVTYVLIKNSQQMFLSLILLEIVVEILCVIDQIYLNIN